MRKVTLIVCILLFHGIAYGADCFDAIGNEGASLAIEINQHRDVWAGYEKERIIYAFSDGRQNKTILVDVRESELTAANISYERCQFKAMSDSFLIKEPITLPANGLYDIRVTPKPGQDALGTFVTTNLAPIIQIKIPNDFGFSHTQVARIAIHEGFHGVYQFSSGHFKIENPQPRDFLKNCRQVKAWNDSTSLQNALLIRSLGENNQVVLKDLWNELSRMRYELSSDVSAKACLDAQRFWERIEGTAHFVETESAYNLGISSIDQIKAELTAQLEPPELSDSFFYYSGNALIRIARSLGINAWSEKIDQGTMIDLLH